MAKYQISLSFLSLTFNIVPFFFTLATSTSTFTFTNQCSYTIWPGILSNAGTTQLSTTGFSLGPAQSTTLSVPTSWSGRLWARTYCTQDSTTGKFTCLTGDCGTGTLECSGNGANPPATLAEFTLNGAGGLDFYDVSLVDGYNLPMMITPEGGTGGNCSTTGCAVDVNLGCPTELRVMSTSTSSSGDDVVVACKSACEAFGDPQYCCTDQYSSSATCKPTAYSESFKSACPRAYSYAYDDGTSTFTCANANYVITFCPPSSGQKLLGDQTPAADAANTNSSTASYSRASPAVTFPSLLLLVLVLSLHLIWHLQSQQY